MIVSTTCYAHAFDARDWVYPWCVTHGALETQLYLYWLL